MNWSRNDPVVVCEQCSGLFERAILTDGRRSPARYCSESCKSLAVRAKYRASWERRFWEKVGRGAADECWEWIGGRDEFGYGKASTIEGSQFFERPHRISWTLESGPIPDGLYVLHR